MSRVLCDTIHAKIREQIDLTDHLVELLSDDHLDWQPPIAKSFAAGVLLGHLLECLSGFCAALFAVHPSRLGHFANLRRLPVNQRSSQAETRQRIREYGDHISEGFSLLEDSDLARLVPTVFVSAGEPLLMLLLGNLEHLINHKHQLFMYLQLIGIEINSRDLYRFRGE
jgi:hypothetical protein